MISSAERLRQALTVAGLGAFERDLREQTLTVTPRLREIFAWSPDETVTVLGFLDRVHPEDRAQVAASIGRADNPAGDGLLSIEHRLLLPDGRIRWVTTNAQTFFEEDQAGQRYARRVGTILDVTGRKEAEERLRASEERYTLFERGVNDGIWDWNVQTGEHYHSTRWKEIVGSRDDAVPNTESSFFDRIHPDDAAAVAEALRRHYEEGARYEVEVRLRHRDGGYRWVLSRGEAVRDEAGRPVRMVGALTDIDSRKHAEAQLRASEERYALFERGVNDGLWDWNIRTGAHYQSPRWKEIVGSRDDAVPYNESSFFDRVHPDDAAAVHEALRRHYEEGARYEVELRLRHRDGGYRWVLSRGEAVRDASGRPVRMVGALTDITDRKAGAGGPEPGPPGARSTRPRSHPRPAGERTRAACAQRQPADRAGRRTPPAGPGAARRCDAAAGARIDRDWDAGERAAAFTRGDACTPARASGTCRPNLSRRPAGLARAPPGAHRGSRPERCPRSLLRRVPQSPGPARSRSTAPARWTIPASG